MTNTEAPSIDLEPNWRLWKVCEMRGRKTFYYEDYRHNPCDWPRCKCERRAALHPFTTNEDVNTNG